MLHLVLRKPLRDHLHSGKKSWGNFAFSLVVTVSMLPECISLPLIGTNAHSEEAWQEVFLYKYIPIYVERELEHGTHAQLNAILK